MKFIYLVNFKKREKMEAVTPPFELFTSVYNQTKNCTSGISLIEYCNPNGPYTCPRQLDTFDIMLMLVLGPIGFLASSTLFVAHLLSKKLRKHPGDLIMMICAAEMLLTFHWTSSAINGSLLHG